ncbi:MAG: curlin [Methyloceanibacter sp.]
MIKSTARAGLVAAVIAGAAVPPATAGSFSFTVTPKGESADYLRHGLQVYGYVNDLKSKNHARVDQRGRGNAAAISQSASGNYGLVYQRGRNHTATLTQSGRNNAYGVFQFGRGGNANVSQRGSGDAGLTFQGSW